jgi:hypothetical protein
VLGSKEWHIVQNIFNCIKNKNAKENIYIGLQVMQLKLWAF